MRPSAIDPHRASLRSMSFQTDLESGIDQQLAVAGGPVTIARNGESVTATAVYGNPERSVAVGEAIVTRRQTSFLILASEYRPTGTASDPLIGDRITRANGHVYEVMRPDSGLDHCEDYGGIGYAWRVQAVRVPA